MTQEYKHIREANEKNLIEISKIIPYENNPKDHTISTPELQKSIRKYGFYTNVILDQKDRLVCGHGRRLAAIEESMTHVPYERIELSDKEYFELMLTDNKIAELSKYSGKKLKTVLELVGALDRPPIAFTQSEIDKKFGVVRDKDGKIVTDFGNSGTVTVEPDEAIKSKKFDLTKTQHTEITQKLKAYIKEHELENESHALVMIFKNIQGAPKTIKKSGPTKVVSPQK